MASIASVAHAVLAASSAGVCATLGAGKEHTQVSARAEINRKNAHCMVVPFVIDDACFSDFLVRRSASFTGASPWILFILAISAA
jgi:type II secretory pathway predicted ATPase ExeA